MPVAAPLLAGSVVSRNAEILGGRTPSWLTEGCQFEAVGTPGQTTWAVTVRIHVANTQTGLPLVTTPVPA